MRRARGNKGRGKRAGKPRRGMNVNVTRVSLKDTVVLTFSASSTLQTIELSPQTVQLVRLKGLGEFFQFYRIKKFEVTVFPFSDTTTTTNMFALSCQPAINGLTDITTFAGVCEVVPNITINTLTTVPRKLRLSTAYLMRNQPSKWWVTAAASTESERIQAHLHIVPYAASTTTLFLSLSYVVEFTAPTPFSGIDSRLELESQHVKGCCCPKCVSLKEKKVKNLKV